MVLLEKSEISDTVDSLAVNMDKYYVFPKLGLKCSETLKENLDDGEYDKLNNPVELAQRLLEDILAVTDDKHLSVRYDPETIAMMKNDEKTNDDQFLKERAERSRKNNYGFKEVKILNGNIGYLKFDGFEGSNQAFKTAINTMGFLSNSDALIVDIRENGGGDPAMIQLLSTYFFGERDVRHLNSFYYRATDDTSHTYTLPYVDGKRLADKDIYILTSNRTFSAAEEFTYNLKNMERAIVVG
jgi:hypothetical protein